MLGRRCARESGYFAELRKGLGADLSEKVDIVWSVELADFVRARRNSFVCVHGILQSMSKDKVFGQSQAPRFHGMRLAKVHVFDMAVVVERHLVTLRPHNAILLQLIHDLLIQLLVFPHLPILVGDGRGVGHLLLLAACCSYRLVPILEERCAGRARDGSQGIGVAVGDVSFPLLDYTGVDICARGEGSSHAFSSMLAGSSWTVGVGERTLNKRPFRSYRFRWSIRRVRDIVLNAIEYAGI